MQQGEQVQISSGEEGSTGDASNTKENNRLYENFLSSDSLKEALKGKNGNSLEVRLAEEMGKGRNLLVEFDRDLRGAGASIALIAADNASDSARALVIAPTTSDVEKLFKSCERFPLEVRTLDEGITATEGSLSQSDSAALVVASFETGQDFDLDGNNVKNVVFYGFSAGAKIPGSDEFEAFLEKLEKHQICFCSDSVPLTLNAAVTRHVRTDDFISVNLEKEQEVQLSHEYYEVGHELLAKPEALATILETEPNLRAIVFCNSPSDTDLLEVLLKKKGLKAKKLIGNVPDRAIHGTMDKVREGEVNILVLTDISGRGFPVEEFDVIVHYAAPEDPEIYLHRLGQPDGSSRLHRVISLVGSMDLGNFHFLKKVVEFDFKAQSLPSAEDIAKARFDRFQQSAVEFSTEDGELLEYAKLVEGSDNRKEFILYLLHQALRKLPEAESSSSGRGGGRGGNRRSRDERDDDHGDFEERGDRGDSRRDRGRDGNRDRKEREERPKPKPTRKDIRFYVGHGLSGGLTEEKFVELVKERMGDEAPELKRSCLRDKYSFFDFEQSDADDVFEAMKDGEYEGEELVFQKAAVLSVPLDEEEEDEAENASEESDDAEEHDADDSDSSADEENSVDAGDDEAEEDKS